MGYVVLDHLSYACLKHIVSLRIEVYTTYVFNPFTASFGKAVHTYFFAGLNYFSLFFSFDDSNEHLSLGLVFCFLRMYLLLKKSVQYADTTTVLSAHEDLTIAPLRVQIYLEAIQIWLKIGLKIKSTQVIFANLKLSSCIIQRSTTATESKYTIIGTLLGCTLISNEN